VSALHAQVFPAYGPLTATLPVTAPLVALTPLDPAQPLTFTQQVTLTYPAFESFVRVWVPGSDPPREALTQVFLNPPWGPNRKGFRGGDVRAWGANQRQLGAPVASGDGQVTLFNLEDIFADTGVVSLQALPEIPGLPAWLTPVGQGYRFTGAGDAPRAILFDYLQREVPAGYEHTLRLYYSPDEGQTWQRLGTTLDTTHNQALAPMPENGQGIYALLATIEMPALQPGWNQWGYPVPGTRPATDALASIESAYASLYFYDQVAARWRLYDVAVLEEHPEYADWLNDLSELAFGRSYWLYATEAVTLYLGLPEVGMRASAAPNPLPATFYGPIVATAHWVPVVGMDVVASIDGVVCGQGQVVEVAGGPAYKVQVRADTGDGCGGPGRLVLFTVGGQRLAETAVLLPTDAWNSQAWYHPLSTPLWPHYLPLVMAAD